MTPAEIALAEEGANADDVPGLAGAVIVPDEGRSSFVERRQQAHVLHPLPRVLRGQAATLGEVVHDGVEPARGRAGEQAPRAVGDRDVRQAGDVDVEDRVLGRGVVGQ